MNINFPSGEFPLGIWGTNEQLIADTSGTDHIITVESTSFIDTSGGVETDGEKRAFAVVDKAQSKE